MTQPRAPLSHGEPTSVAAAESMRCQVETDRAIVLECYREAARWHSRGLTPDECANLCCWLHDPYRARRRCSELKQSGHLRETGETRPTKSGRQSAVLCVAQRQGELWQS